MKPEKGGRGPAPLPRSPWFEPQFGVDIIRWRAEDPDIGRRVVRLVEATLRNPLDGIGHPKPLSGCPGVWSRRITKSHRLFYEIEEDVVVFLQCHGHDLPQHTYERKKREAEGAA